MGGLLERNVLAHQAAQPGVFKLLLPPQGADFDAAPGVCGIALLHDRMNVIQRAVEIEDDGFRVRHGALLIAWLGDRALALDPGFESVPYGSLGTAWSFYFACFAITCLVLFYVLVS